MLWSLGKLLKSKYFSCVRFDNSIGSEVRLVHLPTLYGFLFKDDIIFWPQSTTQETLSYSITGQMIITNLWGGKGSDSLLHISCISILFRELSASSPLMPGFIGGHGMGDDNEG